MFRPVVILALALTSLAATGCQAHRGLQQPARAQEMGFVRSSVPGGSFNLTAFHRLRDADTTLWVFLDGDGLPWSRGGTMVSTDPTPRRPLALELATATAGSALYLARPCYFLEHASRRECEPKWWTSHRYSPTVVDSLDAALRGILGTRQHFKDVVLVGYSGGGTLATLLADRVPQVRAVVTIAANLDVDAWTQFHRYLPLDGSLNPAHEPRRRQDVLSLHLVGSRDENVPPRLNRDYFVARPTETIREYPLFDHACCWVDEWPAIQKSLGLTGHAMPEP